MLQGKNLLNRKKIKIKKRNKAKTIYFVILVFFLLIAFLGAAYVIFINKTAFYISPLAKTKFQENIKLEDALVKANVKFTKALAQNDLSFLVVLMDKEEVIFSSKKDLQSQIASLQLITKRLTIEGKRFKRLDFRYDKPLIIF